MASYSCLSCKKTHRETENIFYRNLKRRTNVEHFQLIYEMKNFSNSIPRIRNVTLKPRFAVDNAELYILPRHEISLITRRTTNRSTEQKLTRTRRMSLITNVLVKHTLMCRRITLKYRSNVSIFKIETSFGK